MSFKHTLSRQLAVLCGTSLIALAVACSDAPTEADEGELVVGDANSISATTTQLGDPVVANRWIEVRRNPSRNGRVIGSQAPGAPGTIIDGPTKVSNREPYPLWRVDFDAGADGWVLGEYLDAAAPPPAPVPAPVANVTVLGAPDSMIVADVAQLSAVLLDDADSVLTDRVVTWSSANTAFATVSSSGLVTAVLAGSAAITATSEERSASVTLRVVAAAAPPPPPVDTLPNPGTGTMFFSSNWTTATGGSSEAFRDAASPTPWAFHCCDGNLNTSIATASSLGLLAWPASNVYRVGTQASSPSSIQTHVVEADLGAPVAGEQRFFRYYLQVVYDDSHGSSSEGNIEHGVETAESGGGDGMNFYRLPRNDGTWFPGYREISSGIRYVASGLRLEKHRTYRLEWGLSYGTSSYTVQVRIFDDAGTLVATEQDFFQYLPTRNTSLLLGAATFTYTPAHHRFFRVGTNGPSSNFPMANMTDDNLFLHGAVAVCRGGWCGPQGTP